MKVLDVLVSSTRQWNPGDEFIDIAVRWLIRRHWPGPINWHLWNRNPDLSVHPTDDWRIRDNIVSNSVCSLDPACIDIVVFSGSPEWLGPRLDPIFDFLAKYQNIPLALVGVGSASPLPDLKPDQAEVLRRPSTVIITRSSILEDQINLALGQDKAVGLPCPAVLAAPELVAGHSSDIVALILQAPDVGGQAIAAEHFEEIRRLVALQEGAFEIVSFYEREYAVLRREFPDVLIRYTDNASEYVDILSSYGTIVSTRLHGALLGLALGIPTALIERSDFRVNSARSMFGKLLPSLTVDEALSWELGVNEGNRAKFRQDIGAFKQRLASEYSRHLNNLFAQIARKRAFVDGETTSNPQLAN